MAKTEQNKQVIRAFLAALGKPDVARLLAFMTDDFRWEIPQDPAYSKLGGVHGKAQWEAMYRRFVQTTATAVDYTITCLTAEEDRVACAAESHADTPRGHFNNRYHFLFTLRDGRISSGVEYADSLYMFMFAQGGAGGAANPAQAVAGALAAHGDRELAGDLEGTMATVSDEPCYEWLLATATVIVEGRAAVREMYRRLLPGVSRQLLADVVGEPVLRFGADHAVVESEHRYRVGDSMRSGRITAVIDFDARGRVRSERATVCDAQLAALIMSGLGADFGTVPGVKIRSATDG